MRSFKKSLKIGILTLTGCLIGACQSPEVSPAPLEGYYDSVEGLTGDALREGLHYIVSENHDPIPFEETDEAFENTDANKLGDVLLLYSRRSEPMIHFIGNGNPTPPNSSGWNREHVWPLSRGAENSDLYNLYPSDENVNSARGNLYFDVSSELEGIIDPAHPEAILCSRDSDSWEPPNEVKGDIARAIFYMDVRYTSLKLTDNKGLLQGRGLYMGKLSTLLAWHHADPVSQREQERNDVVENYQNNRNPFIDRPDFVDKVYLP